MKLNKNIGEKKMNDLWSKLKEVENVYWIVGFFLIVLVANFFGYGGG